MVGQQADVPRLVAVRLQGIEQFPDLHPSLLHEQKAVFHRQGVQRGGPHPGMALKPGIGRIQPFRVGGGQAPLSLAGADHQPPEGGNPGDAVLLGGRHRQNHGRIRRNAGSERGKIIHPAGPQRLRLPRRTPEPQPPLVELHRARIAVPDAERAE